MITYFKIFEINSNKSSIIISKSMNQHLILYLLPINILKNIWAEYDYMENKEMVSNDKFGAA